MYYIKWCHCSQWVRE